MSRRILHIHAGLTALGLVLLAGCRGNVELLETRLRQQEDALRVTQRELTETRQELDSARRESRQLRSELARVSNGEYPVEHVSFVARAEGIAINQLLSGPMPGEDGDNAGPGAVDPAPRFKIVCYPKDASGDVLKVGGDFEIAMTWTPEGGATEPLGRWKIPAAEADTFWHSGFLGTGFHFLVPAQIPPQAESVDVTVTMASTDGRTFETKNRIRVLVPDRTGSAATAEGGTAAATAL